MHEPKARSRVYHAPWDQKRWLSCLAGMLLCMNGMGQRLQRDTTKESFAQLICQTGIFGTGVQHDSISLPGSIYNAVDFRFGWRSRRNGLYTTIYRHPTFGFGFYAATFNRPEIGTPYALYGFVDFPFWNKKDRWQWIYSMAMGLSYNFNPYDREKNPLNTLIGSRQNAYIHFHSRVNHKINDRLSLSMGLGFTHFSNGAYKLPNVGLNKGSLLVGIQYRTSKEKAFTPNHTLPAYNRKIQTDIYWSNGVKNFRPGGAIYWKTGFGMNRTWSIDHRYRLGLGADIFYRTGASNPSFGGNGLENAWSYGAYVAWEWVITEKLFMPLNVGTYFHHYMENGTRHRLYERIGLRYRINRQLYAGVSIKAHLVAADFTEWTIGYRPGKH